MQIFLVLSIPEIILNTWFHVPLFKLYSRDFQRNFSSDFVTLNYSINEESSNRLNKVLRERIHGLVKLDNSFNISDTELSIVPNKTSFPHPSKPTHFPSNPPVFRSNSLISLLTLLYSVLTPIMSNLTPLFPF